MRPRLCNALILVLALAACAPPPGAARLEAGTAEDAAEDTATLAIRETAEVGGLMVTFTGVEGDNRCPKSVQCIVGGQAGVRLAVEDSSGNAEELRIDVPPDATAGGRFGDYGIVVDLEPETKATEPIDPDAYVVTVTVSRNDRADADERGVDNR